MNKNYEEEIKKFEEHYEEMEQDIFDECMEATKRSCFNETVTFSVYVDINTVENKITRIWTGDEIGWTGYCGYGENEKYFLIHSFSNEGEHFYDELYNYKRNYEDIPEDEIEITDDEIEEAIEYDANFENYIIEMIREKGEEIKDILFNNYYEYEDIPEDW